MSITVPFNSIERIQRASANVIASLLGDLSIPLNGFLEEKEKELEKMEERTFNSIERILHHHGLCCVWKFSISIHMDSIQLSPREGLHDYSVC